MVIRVKIGLILPTGLKISKFQRIYLVYIHSSFISLLVNIILSFTWSNDEQIESLSSADCGLSRIGDDPLVVMLQRLQAASRIATSDSDSEITLPTPIY